MNYCFVTISDESNIQNTRYLISSFLHRNYWYKGDIVVLHSSDISDTGMLSVKKFCLDGVCKDIEVRFKKIESEYSLKMHVFSLEGYDRVVFVDSSKIIYGDIRELFENKFDFVTMLDGSTVEFEWRVRSEWDQLDTNVFSVSKKYLSPKWTEEFINFSNFHKLKDGDLWKRFWFRVTMFWKGKVKDNNTLEIKRYNTPNKKTFFDDWSFIKKKRKYKKIAVLMHVYYTDVLEYLLEQLENLSEFELYISTTHDKVGEIEMLMDNRYDYKIFPTDNVGRDVWPTINIINQIDIEQHEFYLKLQTKKSPHMSNGFGQMWLKDLTEPILNKEILPDILEIVSQNWMVGSKECIRRYNKDANIENIDKLCQIFGIENTNFEFIAGTVFWMSRDLVRLIKNANIDIELFSNDDNDAKDYQMSHALERFFGLLVYYNDKKIITV